MTKGEVDLLVDLITKNPTIFSKVTNATMNKNKTDTWENLATYFKAATGIWRTKEQLKSKWDNLKKAARKRSQEIRLNSSKVRNLLHLILILFLLPPFYVDHAPNHQFYFYRQEEGNLPLSQKTRPLKK